MRNDVMHVSAQVDRSILNNALDVKETLATEFHWSKKRVKTFGINDLWSLRRRARLASGRVKTVEVF